VSLSTLSSASRLHIAVTNKTALPAAAARFGAAHGLKVAVTDKPTLAASST